MKNIRSIDDEWDVDILEIECPDMVSSRKKINIVYNGSNLVVRCAPEWFHLVFGVLQDGILERKELRCIDEEYSWFNVIYYFSNGQVHRDHDLPAVLSFYLDGRLSSLVWMQKGDVKRAIGPKLIARHGENKFKLSFKNHHGSNSITNIVDENNIWIKRAKEQLNGYNSLD